ncbi:unnamed protein product [Anisakis simplex]|uniref:Transposase n=1 Tax=Anisakis simplex TaxID=6269 RepID=A0A0M3JS40_ANISI|nr:unnamed protein product [Anisakis simplex]
MSETIQRLKSARTPGNDGLPREIFKCGDRRLIQRLTALDRYIWEHEEPPQELTDAQIVHIFNAKAIEQPAIWFVQTTKDPVWSCSEPICFTRDQQRHPTRESVWSWLHRYDIQRSLTTAEMSRKKTADPFTVFVGLIKAFDLVNRSGLWSVSRRIGCST